MLVVGVWLWGVFWLGVGVVGAGLLGGGGVFFVFVGGLCVFGVGFFGSLWARNASRL